jgi:peptidoglycan/LPS O-acetylase OafA/YrhL
VSTVPDVPVGPVVPVVAERASLPPPGETPRAGAAGEVRPRPRHRQDIQGLRGLAVLLVVVFHAGLGLNGGFVGVDVFFVISGFVITEMLLKEHDATRRIGLPAFYLRRMRRLLPALALVLTVTMALSVLAGPIGATKAALGTGAAAALFAANAHLFWFQRGGYFDVAADQNLQLHTWSLSVEEQFYLVFPSLLAIALWIGLRRRRRARATALVILGAVTLGSFVVSWLMSTGRSPVGGHLQTSFAFYSSLTRAWEFGVGVLLALAASWYAARAGRRVSSAAAWIGLALVAWAAFALTSSVPFPGLWALAPVVGTGLLLAAGKAHAANGPSRALALKPMAWLGDRSYGWYLWHWPLIVFAGALFAGVAWAKPVAALVALLAAMASYRWVENPIRYGPRFKATGTTLRVAAVCVALPLLTVVVASAALGSVGSIHTVKDLKAQLADHADQAPGCSKTLAVARRACTWTVPGATREAVLVGDSNAGHLTEPFVAAANREGYSATALTTGGCPFVDLVLKRFGVVDDQCVHFVHDALRELAAAPPDVLVVSMAADRYLTQDAFALVDPVTGREADDEVSKRAVWAGGLASVLGKLDAAGIPTVLVHAIPKFGEWDLRNCATLRVMVRPASCAPATRSRAEADAARSGAVTAENTAMGTLALVRGVDFADILCPGGVCKAVRDGTWWYRDGRHLSVGGSLLLTDSMADTIRAAAARA